MVADPDRGAGWRDGAGLLKPPPPFRAQDARGRFDSEGEWEPFINEANDGLDAVEWVAKQSWSTGKIGTSGALRTRSTCRTVYRTYYAVQTSWS